MSEVEAWALIILLSVMVIAMLIIIALLYVDRKHWRGRAIEAETVQGLLTEEVMYLRSRPPHKGLHLVGKPNEKP